MRCAGCGREPDNGDVVRWATITITIAVSGASFPGMACLICGPQCLGAAMRVYAESADKIVIDATGAPS